MESNSKVTMKIDEGIEFAPSKKKRLLGLTDELA